MYLVKRNKIYHLFYNDLYGVQKSVSTRCRIKSEANKFAVAFLNDIKKNKIKIKIISYKEFEKFYENYAASRFTNSYQDFVKNTFRQFGKVIIPEIQLKDISKIDIENFIQWKLSKSGERIVNGYLRTLQGAFQRAVEFGYLESNVFVNVKKLKPQQNSPVFLTKDELNKIIDYEKDDQLKFLFKFAAYTGMRMGEIRFLKWGMIDLENNLIRVSNTNEFTTKSKKSRNIPIHLCLRKELSERQSFSDRYVFEQYGTVFTKNYISRKFKQVVIDLGMNDKIHFHSLRHTFASWLVQAGVSIYEVSKLLGHSDIKTTQIYAHLGMNNLSDAVNKLNAD